MKIKEKAWWWLFWRYGTFTCVFGTIYHPPGRLPSEIIQAHESYHVKQAEECGGWWKFYFLYLFCLPLFWNPWRKKWEIEAYIKGSGYAPVVAKSMVRRAMYGWLI